MGDIQRPEFSIFLDMPALVIGNAAIIVTPLPIIPCYLSFVKINFPTLATVSALVITFTNGTPFNFLTAPLIDIFYEATNINIPLGGLLYFDVMESPVPVGRFEMQILPKTPPVALPVTTVNLIPPTSISMEVTDGNGVIVTTPAIAFVIAISAGVVAGGARFIELGFQTQNVGMDLRPVLTPPVNQTLGSSI